jgi:hypothetical protein
MAAYPEDAVCAEEGCERTPVGERPSTRPYVLQDPLGNTLHTYAVGEVDEIVCELHQEE